METTSKILVAVRMEGLTCDEVGPFFLLPLHLRLFPRFVVARHTRALLHRLTLADQFVVYHECTPLAP